MAAGRAYDLVLFGASGYVGRLTAAYLAEHAAADTRVALAGRSPSGSPTSVRRWELPLPAGP